MKICLLDPGIENNSGAPSANLGDLIIQEAVEREIAGVFGNQEIIRFSTHAPLEKQYFQAINNCSLTFVGGTNLLSSDMRAYSQWKIGLRAAFQLRDAILLGVGWWQYQENPTWYTKTIFRAALSSKAVHSVRDNYTKEKLNSIGIQNVINTGCPTMWPLAGIKSETIPTSKSENALSMLTDYSKNPALDKKLLELLTSNYEKVYVWPQGKGDREYISELNVPVIILERSLEALDEFIQGNSFDYVGTRLHGGVRCLLSSRRSLILEIDNRAKEIAQDTGLPTSKRDDFDYISQWIQGQTVTQIKLDLNSIQQWKNQFAMMNRKIS